jgi:hypothetical protein
MTRLSPRTSKHNTSEVRLIQGRANAGFARGQFTHLIWGDLSGIGWGRCCSAKSAKVAFATKHETLA